MELDATFWAFIALLIFFGIVIYFKVPAFVTRALDSRIAKIEADLDEAKRLREEAQALLAEYERRTKAVEDKIAQAEAQALADVRARSADVAIEAARLILADQVKDSGGALVDQSIKDVASRLN